MPSITLNFTVAKGQRVLDAFKGHRLLPNINPGTGQPYTDQEYIKYGIIVLSAREVHNFERSQARSSGHAAMVAAEDAIVEDSAIGT